MRLAEEGHWETILPMSSPTLLRLEVATLKSKDDEPSESSVVALKGPDGQRMVCIGIKDHTSDPYNLFFEGLVLNWMDFIDNTKANPQKRAVLHEGRHKVIPPGTKKNTLIETDSEMLLLAGLAKEEGVDTFSAEPHKYSEAKEIDGDPEDKILYYVMRLGPQMHRTGIVEEEPVGAYLQSNLDEMKEILCEDPLSQFANFDFSYTHIKELYHNKYGRDFRVEDWKFLQSETFINHMPSQPESKESGVRQFARQVNIVRDQYFFRLHEQLWNEGYSVFSLFGEIHVKNIQQQLEALGESIVPYWNVREDI